MRKIYGIFLFIIAVIMILFITFICGIKRLFIYGSLNLNEWEPKNVLLLKWMIELGEYSMCIIYPDYKA